MAIGVPAAPGGGSSQAFSSADLVDDILWRGGESTGAGDRNSDMAQWALSYLNRVYLSLCTGGAELLADVHEDWWWLWKTPPGVLVLQPEYKTGSVSVTNNSTAGVFSVAPTGSLAGYFLKVQGSLLGNADIPRILTHTAGATAFTLDAVFTGQTATAASFDAFKLEYQLAATDILRLISPMRQYRTSDPDYTVQQVDGAAEDASYPLALVEAGMPTRYSIVNVDASGLITVRFNRWGGVDPTDFIRLEYDYLFQPTALLDSSSNYPLVPVSYRRMLADWALVYIHQDKNDDRVQTVEARATKGLLAMMKENQKRLGSAGRFRMGHITTRPSDWMRSQPLRTSSGLVIG